MIRLFVGALLSAVVLFIWGYVFWSASGVMYQFMHRLPDEDKAVQPFQDYGLESGTYLIPFPEPTAMNGTDKEKESVYLARRIKGPLVEIIYRKDGAPSPGNPQVLAVGFCHYFAASLLAAVLLILAQPGLPRYPTRVLFVFLAGVFATVAITFAKPIWFFHPWPTVLYEAVFQTIGWLLAGIVLGLVIRPAKTAPTQVKG
ncbi:MAG TPA: hypothetical protein DDY78_04310 [Planctomycetales bacterium]|jgi:hypothetical protein|nr:hypothetical protein [Planctomycetales bacterium]